jgi:hypothetical protein
MTNTSGGVTPEVQTLHTYNVDHYIRRDGQVVGEKPALQFFREDRVELGRVVLYRAARDNVTVSGVFDSLKGIADVDARDQDGQVLLHIDEITVERHGLASFESREVTVRSLARIAEIGFAWAGLSSQETVEDVSVADLTSLQVTEPVELISA